MKILGISGLDGATSFKRAQWPGRAEREYRMVQGQDSAAALIIDGECVAAVAEERIARQKHTGAFPVGAIEDCLTRAGIELLDLDEVVHGFDYSPYKKMFSLDPMSGEYFREVYSREAVLRSMQRHFPALSPERFHHVNHHAAHAASAYFTSGWDECLVVVADGMGEAHSISIYHARDSKLELCYRLSASDSIGILYSLVTLQLGFDFNSDEYKIMGLAPYGDSGRFGDFFQREIELLENGGIKIPLLRLNRTTEERQFHTASRAYLSEHLIAPRDPEDPITEEHRDVAAALQETLDRVMLHVCGTFGYRCGLRRLAMAGGVALNCTANGKILRSGLFDDIYVQPASGDDGTALGAALLRASTFEPIPNRRMAVPFLGPSFDGKEIEAALESVQDRIETTRLATLEETCAKAAELIAEGRVIAWYRGRMEFGPRALGHRSILADPSVSDMRDRINSMVKKREAFRPFAPAVTLEQVDRWFEVEPMIELPYMTVVVHVREAYRDELPAITHVDGTARVQTASAADNKDFHTLLRAVGETTGREMLLNTSFNVKGQAIVNTPREAIETFLGTGIDELFLENVWVRRVEPDKRGQA